MAETTTILYVVTWWFFVAAWLLSRYIEHLRDGTYRCVRRLRLARTLWVWDHQRTTPLSILGIVAYVGLNIGFILARSRTDLESVRRRAGLTAVTNLVPLFLGSKVCALSDALGVTLQRYYFMHHWFGRLALVEAWVHTAMQIPRIVQLDFHAVSGVLATSLLTIVAFSSFLSFRRLRGFFWAHTALALVSLASLLAHLWATYPASESLEAKIPITVSVASWCSAVIYRLVFIKRGALLHPAAREEVIGATLLDIELSGNAHIYPGAFFYVSLGRWGRGVPLMALKWDEVQDGDTPSAGTAPFHVDDIYTRRLTFLLERSVNVENTQTRLLRTLTRNAHSSPPSQGLSIALDGPYGPNLQLHRFDTICLVAKGIGIAGVFPHALSLVMRKYHDHKRKHDIGSGIPVNFYRDRTKKLNLLWILERNSDYQWMGDSMEQLMSHDPGHHTCNIMVLGMDTKHNRPTLPESFGKHFKFVEVEHNWAWHLDWYLKYYLTSSPGNCAVAACGAVDFRDQAQKSVGRICRPVSFHELEYQPREPYIGTDNRTFHHGQGWPELRARGKGATMQASTVPARRTVTLVGQEQHQTSMRGSLGGTTLNDDVV